MSPVTSSPVPHVVITGLMGAGKTTVGRLLAERLGWNWCDSDLDIEGSTGRTVRELRDEEGVDAMHRLESAQLIDALAAPEANVVSAAASVIEDPAARNALASAGVTVFWLHARPALLAERFESAAHRPAYGTSPESFLAEQAARREPLIAGIGAHRIDVDELTPDEVVARIVAALG